MTKILFPVLSLLIACAFNANAQQIAISQGQKLETVTSFKVNMHIESLGQEIESDNTLNATVEAKNVSDTGYLFHYTITRMKMNSNPMGQHIDFDSDKSEDMNGNMGGAIKKYLNVPQIYEVNKQGKIVGISGNEMQSDDMSQIFNLSTQLAKGQPYPFLTPLAGRTLKKGDTWTDSTGTNDSIKSVYTYTLKENTAGESLIGISGVIKMNHLLKQQGMEIQMALDGTIKGDAVYEKATGILLKNNSITEMKGNMGVMGQTVPINMVCTSFIDVKKL